MTDAIEGFFDELGRRGYEPRLKTRSSTVRCDVVQDGHTDHWFVRNTNGHVEVSRSGGEADMTFRGSARCSIASPPESCTSPPRYCAVS
jgi:hypothetical protein